LFSSIFSSVKKSQGIFSLPQLNISGAELKQYVADIGNPCSDMLLRCHFEGRYLNQHSFFFLKTFLK